jgi:hypothetical protein
MQLRLTGLFQTAIGMMVTATFALSSPVKADPPVDPPPGVEFPPVFCFRVTDILCVAGDADRFQFEFEVLNWTNQNAYGMDLALTKRHLNFGPTIDAAPFIAGASVDPLGRPIGPTNDDANFAAVADSPGFTNGVGAKVGQTNNWSVADQTASRVRWVDPLSTFPLLNRDLLNAPTTQAAINLVPGAVLNLGSPLVPDFETVDNGAAGVSGPGANGVDNVLDGFVIDIDDFDLGESVSFNWLLTNEVGVPILSNAMGFGTFNIFRGAGTGPALWQFQPGSGRSGANTGTTANPRDLFPTRTCPEPFAVEFGPQMTACFLIPTDNFFNVPFNVQAIPEPGTLALSGIALAGLLLRKRSRGRAC